MAKQSFPLLTDETMMTCQYFGKNGVMGLKRHDKYHVLITELIHGYEVEASGNGISTVLRYSSMISLNQNWKRIGEE